MPIAHLCTCNLSHSIWQFPRGASPAHLLDMAEDNIYLQYQSGMNVHHITVLLLLLTQLTITICDYLGVSRLPWTWTYYKQFIITVHS